MAIRFPRAGLALCLPLLLGACGSVNLGSYWPFGGDKPPERNRAPANATEYQCAGGKRFYVRYLEGAAWIILPEREFRLNKTDVAGRYGNGSTVLETAEGGVALREGSTATYAGCKAANPAPN